MPMKVLGPKECPVCHRPFQPARGDLKACSRKCGRRLAWRTMKARGVKMNEAAMAAIKLKARRHVEAIVGKKYKELSVREIELFNLGARVGYQRGYAVAYHKTGRRHLGRPAGPAAAEATAA